MAPQSLVPNPADKLSLSKALFAGVLAGLVAGMAMTAVMLLLALFGVATPLAIIGDRLSVFISPGPFLDLMGRVGGYNHLKQLGVGSTMAGQLLVAALGGAVFGLLARRVNGRVNPADIRYPFIVFAPDYPRCWPLAGPRD